MGDKKIEETKKKVKSEVTTFKQKTKGTVAKIAQTQKEKKKAVEAQKGSKDNDKQIKELNLRLLGLQNNLFAQEKKASARINRILKEKLPDNKTELEPWKKDLAPWYRKMIEKESGIDFKVMGVKGKVWGDLDFKNKGGSIILKFKFP